MTIKQWFEDVRSTFGRRGLRSRWLPLMAAVLATALGTGLAAATALAQAADVELPGISVKAEESGKTEVEMPGLSVRITPPEVHSTVEGEAIDLSGAWKFKGDWLESGLSEGWYKPDFDDSEWRELHVPASWESQGILTDNPRWPIKTDSCGYNGYAWYRTRFTVPESWADGRVLLRIGRIYDQDWTYINGQSVGQMTGGDVWDQQREYLIAPDILRPGEENVIAIRVLDSSRDGGITEGPVELVNVSAEGLAEVLPPEPREYRQTRGDVVRFGSNVTIDADEKVAGDAVAIAGNVDVYGHVTGEAVAVGGSVYARDGGRIDGNATAVGGSVHREPGATIGGEIVETRFSALGLFDRPSHPWAWPRAIVLLAGAVVVWGFIALLSVLLFRERLEVMAAALPVYPARAVLYGLVGFFLTPGALLAAVVVAGFVSAVLAITLVGIPLIPVVGAGLIALIVAGFVLLLAGAVGVWLSIGRAVATSLKKPDLHPVWAALIGLVLVAVAMKLPVIGVLVVLTFIVFGFGLAIMTGFGTSPEWAHRRLGFRSSPPPSAAAPPPVSPSPQPAEPIAPASAGETGATGGQHGPAADESSSTEDTGGPGEEEQPQP